MNKLARIKSLPRWDLNHIKRKIGKSSTVCQKHIGTESNIFKLSESFVASEHKNLKRTYFKQFHKIKCAQQKNFHFYLLYLLGFLTWQSRGRNEWKPQHLPIFPSFCPLETVLIGEDKAWRKCCFNICIVFQFFHQSLNISFFLFVFYFKKYILFQKI